MSATVIVVRSQLAAFEPPVFEQPRSLIASLVLIVAPVVITRAADRPPPLRHSSFYALLSSACFSHLLPTFIAYSESIFRRVVSPYFLSTDSVQGGGRIAAITKP